jgi:hypothetical protein
MAEENKTLQFAELSVLPVDFETIMELLVNRVKERLPNRYTDFLESNIGMELLELFAYESSLLIFLLNKGINEAFLPTCRTKDAIYNLVKTIGYKIKPPSQSSTYCIFTLHFDNIVERVNSIYVNKYITKLTSVDNKEFYLAEDISFPPNISQVKGLVKAGIILEDTFIASGQSRYPYITSSFPVSTVEYVIVNGQFWQYTEFLENVGDKYAYTVEYDNDFRAKILFGSGSYGKIPDTGSEIQVGYSICDGINSNTGANMITNLATQVYYENEQGIITPVTITITNPEAAIGGDDPESPNEARVNAPSVFQTQWRAVTKQDFYNLLRAERGIYKLQVLDRYDNNSIGICEVKIVVIPTGGGIMNTNFKNILLKTLNDRKHITAEVNFLDPRYIPIDVEAVITIKKGISPTTIKIAVLKIIKDYLSYKNRDFGQKISTKEIDTVLRNIVGIERVDNISISEKKYTYVYETFDPAQIKREIIQDIKEKKLEGIINTEENYEGRYRTLKINDTNKLLNIGDNITICRNREIIHKNTIENIDGSIYLLKNQIVDDENNYIKILEGDQVYLILQLADNVPGGTREFTVNNINKLHNIVTGCTVYFEDYEGKTDDYYVSFTDVDKFILSERLERTVTAKKVLFNNIIKRGYVYIKGKDSLIRTEGSYQMGTTLINVSNGDRLATNTYIYRRNGNGTKYYILDISGKTLLISPGLTENIFNNDVFISDVQEIMLSGMEISDNGTHNIIINTIN